MVMATLKYKWERYGRAFHRVTACLEILAQIIVITFCVVASYSASHTPTNAVAPLSHTIASVSGAQIRGNFHTEKQDPTFRGQAGCFQWGAVQNQHVSLISDKIKHGRVKFHCKKGNFSRKTPASGFMRHRACSYVAPAHHVGRALVPLGLRTALERPHRDPPHERDTGRD